MRRRGGREKTWPCSQSTQNPPKLDLDGLDSVSPSGDGPPDGGLSSRGWRASYPRSCASAAGPPAALLVRRRPPSAACPPDASPSWWRQQPAPGPSPRGWSAPSPRAGPRAPGRGDAPLGSLSGLPQATPARRPPSLLLSSHDRSDPTIDCDGASDASGAPTCGHPSQRPGSTLASTLGSRGAKSSRWHRIRARSALAASSSPCPGSDPTATASSARRWLAGPGSRGGAAAGYAARPLDTGDHRR